MLLCCSSSGMGLNLNRKETEEPKILGHLKGSIAPQVNLQNVPVRKEGGRERRGNETVSEEQGWIEAWG